VCVYGMEMGRRGGEGGGMPIHTKFAIQELQ